MSAVENEAATMAHLRELSLDKRNARRHNPRNVSLIESSIQHDGFGRSLLLANDGTKVIAVQRMDIAPGSPEAIRLSLPDNRAASLSVAGRTIVLVGCKVAIAFERRERRVNLVAGQENEQ